MPLAGSLAGGNSGASVSLVVGLAVGLGGTALVVLGLVLARKRLYARRGSFVINEAHANATVAARQRA